MNALNPDQVDSLLRTAGPGAKVHLVGAGGCGMSGLGHLLLDLGCEVTGSDLLVNEEVRQLQARGARISPRHAASHLEPGTVLVVYTPAVHDENPELQAARALGIPAVRRAVLLAALLHRQRAICVAGMHGKTTTSAWLAFALQALEARPSYAIGALVPQLVPHALTSPTEPRTKNPMARPLFVIEADESDGTLGLFRPEHAIVLNVDADHLDHFAGIDAILEDFRFFGEQTTSSLIFCADDPRLAELYARNPRAISYGRHPLAVYRAEMSSLETSREPGASPRTCFEVWHKGERLGLFQTALLGEQNVSNATAVIALLHQLGFQPDAIASAVARFRGVVRRQQELYRDARCRLFDDYGHHPNEIRATLRALKSSGAKRLLVAFQPHRFTRTQHLWKEFATCFGDADRLWLAEIYPASEPEIPGINSGFLAGAIRAENQPVEGVFDFAHLEEAILAAIEPGDLILFLGAGDITRAAHSMADRLRSSPPAAEPEPLLPGMTWTCNESPAMNAELHAQLAQRVSPETVLRRDEPLARRTTLRVGGTADLYVEPASEEDLATILRFCRGASVPVFVLGRGSNLLIRDGGIRGVVLSLAHPRFAEIRVLGETLSCGAGARLKAVVAEARRHGLGGLEFLEGIPGSVGGAMRMNAGAMGSWLFDVIQTISFMDPNGDMHERAASEVNVEYRGCPLLRDHIALRAVLKGQPASQESIRARLESFSRIRWDSQPSQPSAGCIFKNPGTIPAGKLIDELGLKGTRVGGASVSDVHANFIVNDGTATARDVLSLIDIIKARAQSARGIALETEVQILGEG